MPKLTRDVDAMSRARPSLDRAFDELYQDRDRDGSNLRETICAFVDDAKSAGWTIERIIVDLKTTAARSGVAQRKAARTEVGDPESTRALVAESVSWCIQRYYEGSPPK